jgi:tRNA(Ile)-lysidine synthase
VELSKKTYTKIIDCATIKRDLTLRYADATDYIVIDSCGHKKSLHKFFVDEKVPRHLRERIPLVCCGEEVIWIVGYRLNVRCYTTEQSAQGIQITFDARERDASGVIGCENLGRGGDSVMKKE